MGRTQYALARIVFLLIITLALLPRYAIAAGPAGQHHAAKDQVIASLFQGQSATVRFSARWIARTMSFRALGLPDGVGASFAHRPTGSLSVRLSTRRSARPGSYRVRIMATRGSGLAARAAAAGATHVLRVRVDVIAPPGVPASNTARAPAGPGSPAAAPANPSTPVPAHVPTWAYADLCNGGTGASVSLVRQWVTYAASHCGPLGMNVLDACHSGTTSYCTAVQYVDPSRIFSEGSVPIALSAQESWWLHQPGYSDFQHRLRVSDYGGGSFLNQSDPAVISWFQNYVRVGYNAYDALMVDDTAAALNEQLYGSGADLSQELSSNAQLVSAHEQLAAALTHIDGSPYVQIDNGINPNPYVQAPFALLDHPGTMNGLIAEGYPMNNGRLGSYYSSLLDDMAYVDHTANDFMVLLSYDPSGSLRARRVQAATVLLGYSPGHTVSWSDLEQNSPNLAVWPEEGIVGTDAVQTMGQPGGDGCLKGQGVICAAGGHNDLQVAAGVYRREFATCYNLGAAIGPCAAIMNTTGAPVTVKPSWLTLGYHHELTLLGGDVQSGGSVDPSGAPFSAGSTAVPAGDALLLTS
ncbi:MAG: hypothetical protein ACYDHH_05255 [Solirubrobacteraceae bacterium]